MTREGILRRRDRQLSTRVGRENVYSLRLNLSKLCDMRELAAKFGLVLRSLSSKSGTTESRPEKSIRQRAGKSTEANARRGVSGSIPASNFMCASTHVLDVSSQTICISIEF